MVDNQEYGFDKSRFPKLEDESFDCIICSEVVRAPKECTHCGSLFCSACINAWLTKTKECPNRCPNGKDSIKPVGKALLKMYNDLDVKCLHFDKCKQTVKLVDLEKHEKNCQLAKCGNFDICGNKLPTGATVEACSPECLVIMKLKAANGDWGVIHKELKQFMGNLADAKEPIRHHHAKSDTSPVAMSGSMDRPIMFKWDRNRCGASIQLSENDTLALLRENPYIFKTVLGDQGFTSGVHYWEIHGDSRTQNELKIGVSLRNDFDTNTAFCDFDFGFAYYGLGQLRHGSNANGGAYGDKFKKEGILGVCLDMNKGTLSFGLNGKSFGVAYTSLNLKKGPIWPAVALLHCAGCKLVSGKPVPQYFL